MVPSQVLAFSGGFSFKFWSSVFGSALAEEEEKQRSNGKNSQNIEVLSPEAVEFQATGGGDLVIEDNKYLVASGGSTGSDFSVEIPLADQISIYVVKEGDTISHIAEKFGVSGNTIRWANNISSSNISIGDELTILPITGVRHTVKSGESLSAIVDKYDGNLREVLDFNDLANPDAILEGQIVVVPNGQVPQRSSAPSASANTIAQRQQQSISGYYIRPIVGGRKSQGLHGYNAVDLAAPIGTTIRASASGEVIISRNSGWNGGYGNYIVVSHPNGTQTLYAHNSRNIVSVGQWVEQGQTIGHVGSTGRSTGPHVHFEVRGATNPF